MDNSLPNTNMPIKSLDILVRTINDEYRLEPTFNVSIYGRIMANGQIAIVKLIWLDVTPIR